MNKYKIEFTGRLNGSQGITTHYTEIVKADNRDKAVLKLYDKYEHIGNKSIEPIPLYEVGQKVHWSWGRHESYEVVKSWYDNQWLYDLKNNSGHFSGCRVAQGELLPL